MLFNVKKYKKFNHLKTFVYALPRYKILNFKRSKWKALQKKLALFSNINEIVKIENEKSELPKKIIFKKRILPFLNNVYFNSSSKEQKLKKFYKSSLLLKKSVSIFFHDKLVTSDFKKLVKVHSTYREMVILNLLIKPLYLLEILLCKLGFYKTIFELKQSIISKEILVNNQIIGLNYSLKKGDLISFTKFKLPNRLNLPILLQSMLEIDYYNNNVIILINYFEFNLKNLPLIYPERLDINQLIDYIKNK